MDAPQQDSDFDGTCAKSAASAELNEITIEADDGEDSEEGGRRRGLMREARKAACKDVSMETSQNFI